MITADYGESTVGINTDHGGAIDPYTGYEANLRAARTEFMFGKPTYLLTDLPANSAWWLGDGYAWNDVRLRRAAEVSFGDIATPDFEEGFVLEMPGKYSHAYFSRPNQWALVDPEDTFVEGDVPIWSQPVPLDPGPYYEYDGLSGGW